MTECLRFLAWFAVTEGQAVSLGNLYSRGLTGKIGFADLPVSHGCVEAGGLIVLHIGRMLLM